MTIETNAPTRPGGRAKAFGLGRVAAWVVSPIATVVTASFVIYVALSFAPGDPVGQLVGGRATDAQRELARQNLGLDDPVVVRWWHWLTGVVQGDFGTSLTYRQDVSGLLGPRLATTVFLVVMAACLIILVGVGLGCFGGVSRQWRPAVATVTGVGVAIPGFVAASILISIFAVGLGWFPTFGAGDGFTGRLHHLFLPAVALALGWSSYVAQMTMAAVREEAEREHVMTATGRGIASSTIFRRHILRNAAMPVLTASGLTVAGLVAGSVVVETAFSIDGVGSLLVKSVLSKDYEVVAGIALIIITVFVVVVTLLDIAQTLLDPRLRERSAR